MAISLNGSINYSADNKKWQQLFGWQGFGLARSVENSSSQSSTSFTALLVVVKSTAQRSGATSSSDPPAAKLVKLQGKLVAVEGDWIKMSSFGGAQTLKISSNQAKRDHIQGASAWRLGPGRGTKLVYKAHWDNKSGSRGGVKPLVVTRSVLEQVYYKYYCK